MKRLIGYTVALCLLAFSVGCGGVSSTGTLAYVSNSTGTGFTVYTVNTDGTLTASSISPQTTPKPPQVLQFAPNGKWAYFLDATGDNIYAYTRAGNGTLSTLIGTFPVGPGADALVITPNSSFLYTTWQTQSNGTPCTSGSCPNSALAVFSIDSATGILSQVGSNLQAGYPLTQLVMTPGGGTLYGLSPSKQAVLAWVLNSSSGQVTGQVNYPVGTDPIYMVLSANGSNLYVLDHTATNIITNVAPGGQPGPSPQIDGFSVSGTSLTTMPGSPFNENADLLSGVFPSGPIAGATSNDSRYLFVANQGSHNISVFRILTTGEPQEVLGSLTTVNGVSVSTASPFACCATPSFVSVANANNALYVIDLNTGANRIFQFAINQNTGQLRPLSPASVGAENATSKPTWITIR